MYRDQKTSEEITEEKITAEEVQKTSETLLREYENSKKKFGRTVVNDAGSYFTRDGAIYTNQCGLLCIWLALAIQRELNQCSSEIAGTNNYKDTVADLFDDLNHHLIEYSALKRKVCKSSKHAPNGCSACTHTFPQNGNLNRDYFAILANIVGRSIYIWDLFDGKCYKYQPCALSGVIDVERVDQNRKIMIAGLNGHYELITCTFGTVGGNYHHVDDAIRKINNTKYTDRRGGSVVNNIFALPRNLCNVSGRSFITFPCGSAEPIIVRNEVANQVESDAALAWQLAME